MPLWCAKWTASANWDTWGTVSTSQSLTAGTHHVTYSFGTGDTGNVNLDYLDVAQAVATSGTYEAENATLSGGAVIVNIDYPLGVAAYNILREVAVDTAALRGVYVLGKAATPSCFGRSLYTKT